MGYDLVFWRQDDSEQREPRALYEAFLDRKQVDGIAELPIDDFISAIVNAFPTAVREPNGDIEWLDWRSPDGSSGVEVEWTDQCVWASLRPLDEDRANTIIDIANGFGCALYDPQPDERFGL